MDNPLVRTDTSGRVRVLTINRPEARNALDNGLTDALLDALVALDEDGSVTVGVLTGAGGVFCGGMDLKAFAAEGPPRRLHTLYWRRSVKPLIAAIEGYAYGGGLELGLICDILVAAKGAKLGIPEATFGLFAAGGGLVRLGHRLPYSVVMEMALSGAPITAEQACAHGLVNRLTERGATLDVALELAQRIAGNAPMSLLASKALVSDAADMNEAEFFEHQKSYARKIMQSNDAAEGARAFAERRTPVWINS